MSLSSVSSGPSGARAAALILLTAACIGAVAFLVFGGQDSRTGVPATIPTATRAVLGPTTTTAGVVTPAAEQPAGGDAGAPVVADVVATAASARPRSADPDPLAPVRTVEAAGYVDTARQSYAAMVASDGAGLAARVALARLALGEGDHAAALKALEGSVPSATSSAETGTTPVAPPAAEVLGHLSEVPAGLYLYGLALEAVGRHRYAAAAFARYGGVEPVMVDIAAMAEGNNLFALGDFASALDAFTLARDQAGDDGTASLAALRRGNALLRLGPPDAALAAYADAYQRARNDGERAQALAGTIAAYAASDDSEAVTDTRLRLVRELPGTPLASAALEKLTTAGVTVIPAEEAAVRAGNGDLWAALTLLTGAMAENPRHPAAWSLDVVRWYRAVGEHAHVVETAAALLATRPDDPLAGEIAWERAQAFEKLGEDRAAADAYDAVADRWPTGAFAAQGLWRRAWLLLATGDSTAAAAAFELVAARYPDFDDAPDARFRAGLMAWRAGDLPHAAEHWTAVAENNAGFHRARAEYWLGRAAADSGAMELSTAHWQAAAAADPMGYYGIRAAERLGVPVDRAPGAVSSTGGADFDAAVPRWLVGWQPGTSAASWAEARDAVRSRREVRRAAAWLDVGERNAALRAMRAANTVLAGDTASQALLAREAARLGLWDAATSAAGEVLAAAPPGARLTAPAALARLAYPDPFGDLVRREAAGNGIPPALLFALIRQESRFEPAVRSGAGASGLTQVMPKTGEGIARLLNEPDFAVEKLNQPHYALRFGAFFLARQLTQFHGQPLAALAAYNSGPGNAQRWSNDAGGDPDLFAELIDFRETRLYVRLVAEHAAHYRRLYAEMR